MFSIPTLHNEIKNFARFRDNKFWPIFPILAQNVLVQNWPKFDNEALHLEPGKCLAYSCLNGRRTARLVDISGALYRQGPNKIYQISMEFRQPNFQGWQGVMGRIAMRVSVVFSFFMIKWTPSRTSNCKPFWPRASIAEAVLRMTLLLLMLCWRTFII